MIGAAKFFIIKVCFGIRYISEHDVQGDGLALLFTPVHTKCPRSLLAACRSGKSKPSVNQAYRGIKRPLASSLRP